MLQLLRLLSCTCVHLCICLQATRAVIELDFLFFFLARHVRAEPSEVVAVFTKRSLRNQEVLRVVASTASYASGGLLGFRFDFLKLTTSSFYSLYLLTSFSSTSNDDVFDNVLLLRCIESRKH